MFCVAAIYLSLSKGSVERSRFTSCSSLQVCGVLVLFVLFAVWLLWPHIQAPVPTVTFVVAQSARFQEGGAILAASAASPLVVRRSQFVGCSSALGGTAVALIETAATVTDR